MRCAVDGILYREGKIVLIKRGGKTFHGYWALPGGIIEEGEAVEEALTREMKEELSVETMPQEILGVYSEKNRDPREHTISVVFICDYSGELRAGDDARECGQYTIEEVEEMLVAFDHKKIISDFKKWLERKGTFWSNK